MWEDLRTVAWNLYDSAMPDNEQARVLQRNKLDEYNLGDLERTTEDDTAQSYTILIFEFVCNDTIFNF
jgi:hypothetical protein